MSFISTWSVTEEVEAIIKDIEQHFVEMGRKMGWDLAFSTIFLEEKTDEDV